jgi:hypothetical protein
MIHRTEVADAFDVVSQTVAELTTELRRETPDYTRCADLTQRLAVLWAHAVGMGAVWVAAAVEMGVATAEGNRN